MASGGRTFSPEEIHDILDQSDDFDDEHLSFTWLRSKTSPIKALSH